MSIIGRNLEDPPVINDLGLALYLWIMADAEASEEQASPVISKLLPKDMTKH